MNYGGSFVGSSVTVRKDSSPPGVSASAARGPDANGWYTSPVAFSFTGDDGASGVASCTSGTYSGPDGASAAVTGSCTDNAGNTGSVTLTIKYDATPPTVLGVPARPPDANGWYNHPVDVAFSGNDAASGVIECSPTVTYKGPDANPAKLVGQCRDAAGQLSEPTTVELRYDGTAPARSERAMGPTAAGPCRSRGRRARTSLWRRFSVLPASRGRRRSRVLGEGPEVRRSQGRLGQALLVRDLRCTTWRGTAPRRRSG